MTSVRAYRNVSRGFGAKAREIVGTGPEFSEEANQGLLTALEKGQERL